MGSGYTHTTNHKLTEGHQRGRKRQGKKERRGGKTAPEEEYNTGKEKRGGGWREKEKDNGERSRMVQIDSFL